MAALGCDPDSDGNEPVGFDEERQTYVYDHDGDGIVDTPEGTDMDDPDDPDGAAVLAGPGPEQQPASFPAASCRVGFQQAGDRLCISTSVQGSATYHLASMLCRDKKSHVCTIEDLTYLKYRSGLAGSYSPLNRWIGNTVGDDTVLCGNGPFSDDVNTSNFDGSCWNGSSHGYWCCHDDA